MSGWIKYNRMLLDSSTFQRGASYIALFTHILLNAQCKNAYRSRIDQGQLETSYEQLSKETDIASYTVRRMLINMQNDGLLTVENKQNRYTLVTVNDWQLYNDAISGWVPLERDTEWHNDPEYMGVMLYLILSADYHTGQIPTNKLKSWVTQKVLRKLVHNNFIEISKDKTVITLIDKRFHEPAVKPMQNQSNAVANLPQDHGNSAVTAYIGIKNEDLKKEEERSAFPLAEKLSEVFARKGIKQQDDLKSLANRIQQVINTGASGEHIAECIDWLGKEYFGKIYNGYTFQEYFYSLSEAVECSKREAEKLKQAKMVEIEKIRLEEEKHEQAVSDLRIAHDRDKFLIIKLTSGTPKFALNMLNNMVERGEATPEEADQIAYELNLKAV